AYSKLLFQMGRTDEAIAANQEGLTRFDSVSLLSVDAIEKVYLWQQHRRPFDPFSEFFHHAANPAGEALRFHFSTDRLRIGSAAAPVEISLERALVGALHIHPETGYVANVGPFRIEQDFEDALEARFAIAPLVSVPIFEAWAMGRLSQDELSFTNERLGTEGLQAAIDAATEVNLTDPSCRLRLWQVGDDAWVGYSPELGLSTHGATRASAEQKLREARNRPSHQCGAAAPS
ncbi:MAG: hypothetical protein R6V29_08885, partial [Spirochaetia bacterium]